MNLHISRNDLKPLTGIETWEVQFPIGVLAARRNDLKPLTGIETLEGFGGFPVS